MKTRCRHLGCSGYGMIGTGFCPAHAGEFVPRRPFQGAEKTTISSAHYGTTEWRNFTKDYLRRHPVCVLCGNPSQATDHHLMSAPEMIRQHGGFIYDERYYRALCTSCNTKERNRKYSRRTK